MEKLKKYSCLIIGLGQIGMLYDIKLPKKDYTLTHANAFSKHSRFNLLGGVDSNLTNRETFSKAYKKPSFSKIKDALYLTDPDVVVISVPTNLHYSVFCEVIKNHKPLAILCEKPISENLEKANLMCKKCKKLDIQLFVNFIRRTLPLSIEIKKRIETNKIKKPIRVNVWYSKGLLHNASHAFDLMTFWFGNCKKVKSVKYIREIKNYGDEVIALANFGSTDVMFIPAWEEFYSHNSLEIISKNGRLYWNQNICIWEQLRTNLNENLDYPDAFKVEKIKPDLNNYQFYLLQQLCFALDKKKSHISTGKEVLSSFKMIEKILKD